jgi:hypothetical protein
MIFKGLINKIGIPIYRSLCLSGFIENIPGTNRYFFGKFSIVPMGRKTVSRHPWPGRCPGLFSDVPMGHAYPLIDKSANQQVSKSINHPINQSLNLLKGFIQIKNPIFVIQICPL